MKKSTFFFSTRQNGGLKSFFLPFEHTNRPPYIPISRFFPFPLIANALTRAHCARNASETPAFAIVTETPAFAIVIKTFLQKTRRVIPNTSFGIEHSATEKIPKILLALFASIR